MNLHTVRARIASWIAPASAPIEAPAAAASTPRRSNSMAMQQRMYAAAMRSRLNADRPATTGSADSELATSLTNLRNMSRQLVRDNPYAKRARAIVVNNVVGAGIGLQAQVMSSRDKLHERVNASIEDAWREWCRADICHAGGQLHFCDFERLAMGEVFDAGEVIIRKHFRPFGRGSIPYALELIEPERLANESTPVTVPSRDALVRMGVEADEFGRPQYYWIRKGHPGDLRAAREATTTLERVPASDIIHLRMIDRWPQTRGEPWLHTVIQRLGDMGGYTEAEIVAARAAACYMGFIKGAEDPVGPVPGDPNAPADPMEDQQELEFSPGMVRRLMSGEDYIPHTPNRPNAALDPFMRFMLREVAAGIGVSYESLSRDYSASNYSSSRLALLDDRDLWRVLQGWFLRSFREIVHREWLQQAVLVGAVPGISVVEYANNVRKFEAARFKLRGWGWIDPTKEVAAYKEAIRGGLTTVSDVIAATAGGQDIEDILATRERELQLMKEKGLVFDTDPAKAAAEKPNPAPVKPDPEQDDETDPEDDASSARVISIAQSVRGAQ